jgi:hypothetical protein
MGAEIGWCRCERAAMNEKKNGTSLDVWVSFGDLVRAGIIANWYTLRMWQKDPKIAFPKGRLFGPNSRRWSKQHDIDPWLASRPIERDAYNLPPRKRGRPRNPRKKEEPTQGNQIAK